MRVARVGALVGALVVAAVSASPPARAQVATGVMRVERTFEVKNPADGRLHTLAGYEVLPACAAGTAADTVIILQHGLSYTGETWDVPGYSYARILAAAGYAVVAVDRLGYGRSPLANGRDVTTLAYGKMAAQLARQLGDRYEHVVLAGHSAGGEAVVEAAGLFAAPIDALVVMGYHTFPDPLFLAQDWVPGDQVRALASDYEYFFGTPERRAEMFYTDAVDPAIVALDTAHAVLTPSGEVQTISFQASRIGSVLVRVPVLAQLAEGDRLFPSMFASLWAAQFLLAPSVTVDVVPGTGHTYMLHRAGPDAARRIAAWLGDTARLGGCSAATAAIGTAAPVDAPAPAAAPPGDTLPATGPAQPGGAVALALLGCALVARVTRRRCLPGFRRA